MKPAAGQDAWSTIGLFYPQKAEKDETGKSIVHNLTQGNSSFPHARYRHLHPKHQHSKSGGHQHSYRDSAYLRQPQRHQCQVVDLWKLDENLKFSALAAGKYNLTITGTTDSGSTVTLLDTTFTVGAATTTTPEAPNNTYTVTFVVQRQNRGNAHL